MARLLGKMIIVTGLISLTIFMALPAPAGQTIRAELAGRRLSLTAANDFSSRIKGLGGVTSMAWNEGMLFIYPDSGIRGFWMKGMKMPIDIIWLFEGRVIGLSPKMAPPRPGERPAAAKSPGIVDMVLEVNAGWAKSVGLKLGDELTLVDPLPPVRE